MSITVRELLTRWVFSADTSKVIAFEKAVLRTKEVAKTTAKAIAGVAAAGTAGAVGIFKMTEKIAEHADEIEKAAARTSVGTELLQQLKAAAVRTEVAWTPMIKGLRTFTLATGQAAKGNKTFKAVFAELGLQLKDSHGKIRSTDDLVEETIYRLADMTDETKKITLAQKLFGRAGAEMLPMLEEGSMGLAKMMAEARGAGKVLGKDALEAGDKLDKNLRVLRGTMGFLKTQIGSALVPVVSEVVDKVNKWVKANKGLIGQKLQEIAGRIADAVRELMKAAERVDIFKRLSDAVTIFVKVVTWLLEHRTAVKWFFMAFIAGAAVEKVAPAIGLVSSALKVLKFIAISHPILGLLTALIALGIYVEQNWKDIGDQWDYMSKQSGTWAADWAKPWSEWILKVRQWFSDLFDDINEGFSNVISGKAFTMTPEQMAAQAINRARRHAADFDLNKRALDVVNANMRQSMVTGGSGSKPALGPVGGMTGAPLNVTNNVTVTVPPGATASQAQRTADSVLDAMAKVNRRSLPSVRP